MPEKPLFIPEIEKIVILKQDKDGKIFLPDTDGLTVRNKRDGDIFYQDVPTGMYTYEDAWHRLGLMSGDFVRLTPPLFSDITAESKDVFFAEYLDSGLGVLINRKGTIIK